MGGFFESVENFGVVFGVDVGELDFDLVFVDGVYDGFGDVEVVDMVVDDCNGVFEFVFVNVGWEIGEGFFIDFEGKDDVVFEIEVELEIVFGFFEEVVEEDFVVVVDIFDVVEIEVREKIFCEVELVFGGDLFEIDKYVGGLMGGLVVGGFFEKGVEFCFFSGGFGFDVGGEVLVLDWDELVGCL